MQRLLGRLKRCGGTAEEEDEHERPDVDWA